MSDAPTIEELFRRWRDGGDPEAFGEVLARAEDELLAIARRQSRDESAARDLVQATWFTVVADARRWDDGLRLMPWLVGILQIEARRARRDAGRAPDPERVHAPAAERADDAAFRAEARRAVEQGIAELPALYAEVVDLHLLRGLTHHEIAAQTGRAPGTVRVQVFRGLARLRELLPASLSLGVALAVFAPGSAAARLAPVLDRAADARGAPAPSSAPDGDGPAAPESGATHAGGPAGATAGGLLTGAALRWIAAAAAAALAGTVAWQALRPAREESAALRADLHPATAAERGLPRADLAPSGARASAAPVESAAAAPAGAAPPRAGVWLVARVERLAGLAPGEPTLRVRTPDPGVARWATPDGTHARVELDLSDWYAGGGPAPRELLVEYDHPNALPARAALRLDGAELAQLARASGAGARHEIAVTFALAPPAARVHGRAAFAPGAPAGATLVAALFETGADGAPGAEPVEGVALRPDGTFVLRAARAGAHRLVVAAAGAAARPHHAALDLAAGEQRDAGLALLEPGPALAGSVAADGSAGALAAQGVAPAGLVPLVRWRRAGLDHGAERLCAVHGVPLAWTGASFENPDGAAAVGSDGTFRIAGLGGGPHVLSATWSGLTALLAAAPARGAEAAHGAEAALRAEPAHGAEAARSAEAEDGAGAVRRAEPPASGIALDAPPVWALRVRAEGVPLAGAHVVVGAAAAEVVATTDAAGVVLGCGAPGGALRVAAAGRVARTIEAAQLAPGTVLDVELERAAGAALWLAAELPVDWRGAEVVLVPRGAAQADAPAALARGEVPAVTGVLRAPVEADGSVHAAASPGSYWALVRARRDAVEGLLGHARPFVAPLEVQHGRAARLDVAFELAGRLRFEPVGGAAGAGRVELELRAYDGARVPLSVASLALRGDARHGRALLADALPYAAHGISGLLAPGDYVLRATWDGATVERALHVSAGQTTVVALEAR